MTIARRAAACTFLCAAMLSGCSDDADTSSETEAYTDTEGESDTSTPETTDTSGDVGDNPADLDQNDSGAPTPDRDVPAETTLDDIPEVLYEVTAGQSSESGDEASIEVRLSGPPPAGDAIIAVTSSDSDEGLPDTETLVFDAENWDTPQVITVVGVDDDVADGDQDYQLELELVDVGGEDLDLADIPTISIDLVNTDDDEAAIRLVVEGDTSEGGTTSTLSIALTSSPVEDVSIHISVDDETEGSVDDVPLVFTSDNWNVPQSVTLTGVDDDEVDGDQTYDVIATATSDDATYDGLTSAASVVNRDDDRGGDGTSIFVVTIVQSSSSEGGQEATFTVALSTEPSANVEVGVRSNDETEGVPVVQRLRFTPTNWRAPQTVIVSGQDDDEMDGNQEYDVVLDPSGSMAPEFADAAPTLVALTNIDNDTAGFTLSAISGPTNEGGGQATFGIALTYPPEEDVRVGFQSEDPSEGVTTAASLTFTSVNWAAPQTVTVNGIDDDISDGDQTYDIVFAPAESSDPNYDGLMPPSVQVVNEDNDSPGIVARATNATSMETGEAAVVSIALASVPAAEVTLSLESSDTTEGTLTKTSLVFSPANWNAPQLVEVAGVDDDLLDGDQPYDLVVSNVASGDANYDGLAPVSVALSNLDDESPGVRVTRSSFSTSESGATALLRFTLRSRPSMDVSFGLSSSDATEGRLITTSLTFTPDNWDVEQTVTLYGVDDDLADGNQVYFVNVGTTVSEDPNQDGAATPSLGFTNTDDDTAGITVSAISGNTGEDGTAATFTVVLTSRPFEDVTVNFDTSDDAEGIPDVTSLAFTAANWDAPQTVTVTGQNDDLADGNQPYAIEFSATTSADPAYAALTPANISVTNDDDDEAGFVVSAISGDVSEDEGTATFTVALTSEPLGEVVVTVTSEDEGEAVVSTASLTFDNGNWSDAQTVTVTGVDDDVTDGDVDVTITLAIGGGTTDTTGYADLNPDDVTVTNLDNDIGAVSGTVVSALNGARISGATVSIYGTALSTTTNASGNFTITGVPPGSRTVQVSATDFDDAQVDVEITAGATTNAGTIVLNPTLAEGELRAVLTWTPTRDLDFHAYTPGGEHIYYSNRTGTNISLDTDSGSGGPESIAISVMAAGTYTFHVYNFDEDLSICSTGAVVRVFDSTGLVATLDPSGLACSGSDYQWNAFTLNGGTVTATGTVSAGPP